jgi:hypothetical protein
MIRRPAFLKYFLIPLPKLGKGKRNPNKAKSENYKRAYPDELERREVKLLRKRRRNSSRISPKTEKKQTLHDFDPVGFALSGGGVRSATFCLGIFQGLARHKLIRHIDYLSTVSGGGYFGAFLGRLFTREYIHSSDDIEKTLLEQEITPSHSSSQQTCCCANSSETPPPRDAVFRWLRENGRYLSPNGAGDLLLGSAVLVRNWAAIHVVLLSFILMLFLPPQLIRGGIEVVLLKNHWQGNTNEDWLASLYTIPAHLPGSDFLWWSPYLILVALIFILYVVPTASSYWLLIRSLEGNWIKERVLQWIILAAVVGLAAVSLHHLSGKYQYTRLAFSGVLLSGFIAAGFSLWAEKKARQKVRQQGQGSLPQKTKEASSQAQLFKDNVARHWISLQLKTAMVLLGAVLVFALIDSLGQTIYVFLIYPSDSTLGAWLTGTFAALTGFAVAARRIAVFFGGEPDHERLSLPLSIVATVAAVVILTVALAAVSAFSHAIAWEFKVPLNAPAVLLKAAIRLWKSPSIGEVDAASRICVHRLSSGEPCWGFHVFWAVLGCF